MVADTSDPRPRASDEAEPGRAHSDPATLGAAEAAASASTLVVMGVSGSGKTTVASTLAERLARPLLEGDDMHSAGAIEKMASGHPLDDDDRWPWLRRIRAWIETQAEAGRPGVIACSALKHSYRELLADGGGVVFIYLHVGRAELHRRLEQRTGHYMKAEMLDSQLDSLEPPATDEPAVTVEAQRSSDRIVAEILRRVASG